MKLEQQLTSLEISKKLKELGVKQESYFVWAEAVGWKGGKLFRKPESGETLPYTIMDEISSAFTVAELGEMLPQRLSPKTATHQETYLESYPSVEKRTWCICYCRLDGISEHTTIADTEADARGKMLTYLLENKLITL